MFETRWNITSGNPNGSTSSSGAMDPGGTPTGVHAITVVATSGAVTGNVTLNLTVAP